MKLEIFSIFFEKFSHIKFHEISSRGSQIVTCGWTEGHTGMTKLTVGLYNFVNAPKKLINSNSVIK